MGGKNETKVNKIIRQNTSLKKPKYLPPEGLHYGFYEGPSEGNESSKLEKCSTH